MIQTTKTQIKVRIRHPTLFKAKSYKLQKAGTIILVIGKLKKNNKWATQSIRFSRKEYAHKKGQILPKTMAAAKRLHRLKQTYKF